MSELCDSLSELHNAFRDYVEIFIKYELLKNKIKNNKRTGKCSSTDRLHVLNYLLMIHLTIQIYEKKPKFLVPVGG